MSVKMRYVKEHLHGRIRMKSVLLWVFQIAAAIVLGAVFSIFFCKNVEMTEGSMEPIIAIGDTVLVNTLAYRFGSPDRDDILVFKSNDSANASLHVKRVIGLPGEKIQISDGQIMINGVTYMEKKDLPSISYAGLAETEITLKDDEYFVLGDNRNNSADSRYADIGNVTRSNIVGKVWFRISPYTKLGFLR